MQGGARGCVARKSQCDKNQEKRRKKITEPRKFTKITTMSFTNGLKERTFQGGNPPHPRFFRNPHLPKISPAYVPGHCISISACTGIAQTFIFKNINNNIVNSAIFY